jgi:hypothetical protein
VVPEWFERENEHSVQRLFEVMVETKLQEWKWRVAFAIHLESWYSLTFYYMQLMGFKT